jgi:conjugal transfer pilus assembly protein TrbC
MLKSRLSILVLSVCACGSIWAQTRAPELPTRSPTQEQEQLKANRNFLDGIAGPASNQVQQQGQANKAAIEATNSMVPAPAPGSKSITREDFTSLANTGSLSQKPIPPGKKADILIFVSTSMPDSMLKNYARQAREFGAVLMMRGFVDDKLSATREKLANIDPEANWEINPEPFKTFKIDRVPAIVVADATNSSVTEEGCAVPTAFTSVYGDITVASALDKIVVRGQPSIAPIAKQMLTSWQATFQPKRVVR